MDHASARSRAGLALLAIGLGLGMAPSLTSGPSAYGEAATASAAVRHSGNLIRNPGAERTDGRPRGSGKVGVKGWTVKKQDRFTAVPYGAPSFPEDDSPGSPTRGDNFFAGGDGGSRSVATQQESLAHWSAWIAKGRARFTLSAWLGGYATQKDNAVVSLTWLDAKGARVGHAHLGPVTSSQRGSVTGMLFREKSGKVPPTARAVLVTMTMRRAEGDYNDGYADDLSLVISRRQG